MAVNICHQTQASVKCGLNEHNTSYSWEFSLTRTVGNVPQ